MVWRVCRRWLRDFQEAEDAFQATFLILARKAGSLGHKERVAGWLHGVACRVARRLVEVGMPFVGSSWEAGTRTTTTGTG